MESSSPEGGFERTFKGCFGSRKPPWDFVTGNLLAPLSLRDMWILNKAVVFMKQLHESDPDRELADPNGHRYYRHVLDWLREPTDDDYPHWKHTNRADDAAYLAEYGESSDGGCYTSDEDE